MAVYFFYGDEEFNIELEINKFKKNLASNFAELSGAVASKTASFDASGVTLQYQKKGDANWTTIENDQLNISGDNFSYKLTNLTPETSYSFRLSYNDNGNPVISNVVDFKTEKQETIYNGGFDEWWQDGPCWYPNERGKKDYWNSSNPGSTSISEDYNVTTPFDMDGSKVAKLASQYVVIKFAAASLFTGKFIGLIKTIGAKLDWGIPFSSRPSALKGRLNYQPGLINRGTKPDGAPAKGENDACQIYCVLLSEQLHVGGNATETDNGIYYENSTKIDWMNDNRIIAYGEITKNENTNGWIDFTIPLVYHTTTETPQYMAIVCSANKWGDYFYGSDNTVLYVDDFSFEYGEPTVK